MGTFQITAPNGKKYRVTGDDPNGAMAALKKMIGADTPPPEVKIDPATNQPEGVPEFKPAGVEGYNPKTGEVERSKSNSAAMGAADTTTFGFGDEGAAVLGSLLTGAPREQVLSEIRGNQADAQRDNPKSYLGGQLAGGVAQGLVAGPGILASAPTTLGRVIGGAATGGLMGGIYGAGSGTDAKSRVIEALKSGGIGTLAGGAFPLLAKGVSSGYSAIADALRGGSVAKQAGTSPEVLRMLNTALEADGTLGPRGQANMAAAGPDAMLADAGPNAKAILDTSIQRGGPGAVAAREAVSERAGNAASAITNALDQSLGSPEGIDAARAAIRQSTAKARSSAYDAAYNSAIDYADPRGQALEALIKGRVPGRVIADANELMRLGGDQSKQILAHVADDGSVTFERLPDVRQIDYITRALNQAAESGDGAGALGGQTPKGRAYQSLAGEIRDTLKGLVPEYGKALETAADPIRRSKAVEFGSKLLSPSTTRDQVDEFARGLTGPERDAAAQGIRSRLDDLMANVTRTVQDGDTTSREAIKALKDLSSRANREKVEAIIGTDKAKTLFDEVDRAAKSFDLRASVADNSKTYARQATQARVDEVTAPGPVGKLLQGEPLKAGKSVVQALTGQTPANVASKQDAIYSEISRVLTRPQGSKIMDALNLIGKKDQATKLMSDRIVRALAGPHLSYPIATQSGGMLPTPGRKSP